MQITLTHETELAALEGRVVHIIDPHGEEKDYGILTAHTEAGRRFWRVTWGSCRKPTNRTFELGDIADLAGTVIELRHA